MSAELPRVTVIIPCYNQAHFLRESLASVLEQTEQRFQIIVIDDASPDAPTMRNVIQTLGDTRIQLLSHEQNRGLAAARNTGVRASRTAYFICLDPDDVFDSRLLERTLSFVCENDSIDCVITDYVDFGMSDKRHVCSVPSASSILAGQPLLSSGVLMRKDMWSRAGGYDEAAVLRNGREDWEFYIRVFHASCRAVHCPEALYMYRTYPTSMNFRCWRVEHQVRRYIYYKHRGLFDRTEQYQMLGIGFDRATVAAIGDRRRLAAVIYSIRAIRYGINSKRLTRLARAILPDSLVFGLRWVARTPLPIGTSRR